MGGPHPVRPQLRDQGRRRPGPHPAGAVHPRRRLPRGRGPPLPLASPLFADLRGLPPLLIQAGTYEILLDDAVRLAAKAADDNVAATLQTFPGAPHVFQGFSAVLAEGARALDQVGAYIRTHLDRQAA